MDTTTSIFPEIDKSKIYKITKVAKAPNAKVDAATWEEHQAGAEKSLPIEYTVIGRVINTEVNSLVVDRYNRNGVEVRGVMQTSPITDITETDGKFFVTTANSVYVLEAIKGDITYVVGDATNPKVDEGYCFLIAHICNDIGAWGKGFVVPLGQRFPEAKALYQGWFKNVCRDKGAYAGEVQFVPTSDGNIIANMVAQRGIFNANDGTPPIRYEWLDKCLAKLATFCMAFNARAIHIPRIGCGLAGGTWDKVEPLLRKNLTERGISVIVYDLE